MKKDRRFPGKLNTVRMALSFLIALALFVHAPLQARAYDTGVKITPFNSSGNYIPLTFGGAVSPSDTIWSYTYEGSFTILLAIDPTSGYQFYNGFIALPVSLSCPAQTDGTNYGSMLASISDVQAPDGISFAMEYVSSSSPMSGPPYYNFNLWIQFDSARIAGRTLASVTFDVSSSSWTYSNKFGAQHVSRLCSVKFSPFQGSVAKYANVWDIDPMAAMLKARLDTSNSYLGNIFTAIQNNTSSTATWMQTLVNHVDANHRAQISNDNTNRDKIISALNANSRAEIADADTNAANIISTLNANHKAQTENDDKNADNIMHDYDTTDQDSDNKRFEDSRKELQEQEDSLFSSAMEGFGSLDMSDYSLGRFSAMQGAFSFVSGFIQSCYVKMGDFGAVVTVGLVLLIATKVIGLFRFQVVEH